MKKIISIASLLCSSTAFARGLTDTQQHLIIQQSNVLFIINQAAYIFSIVLFLKAAFAMVGFLKGGEAEKNFHTPFIDAFTAMLLALIPSLWSIYHVI